jgi:hypothetical protein
MKENKLAEDLTDYVNTYSVREKIKDFISSFTCKHRTLQQSSFGLFLSLMEHMTTDEYRTDGRNEASKNVAKMLVDGFRGEYKKSLMDQGYSEEYANKEVVNLLPSMFLPFI